MVNNREKGSVQERKAAQFLINNGLTILEMNFSIRMGEIDIICKDNDTYVFAEVKYRKDNSHGYPYEAVKSILSSLIPHLNSDMEDSRPQTKRLSSSESSKKRNQKFLHKLSNRLSIFHISYLKRF